MADSSQSERSDLVTNYLAKFLDSECWLANMNHPVAVGTQHCEVLEFGLGASALGEWNLVMTLCETIAPIAVNS